MVRPRFLSVVCLFLLLTALGCKRGAVPAAGAGASGLDGAWENVTPGFNPALRQVKHINGGQFTWTISDRSRGIMVLMSGGSCTVQGNSYKETIEYCNPGIQERLLGQEQTLTVQLQGDQVTFTGVLTSGVQINETFQRLR